MKLTKTQMKEHSLRSMRLGATLDNLDGVCIAYNEATDKDAAMPALALAVAAHNTAIDDARAFCEEITSEIGDFIDGKSEGWQEGDKGEAHVSWKEQWEEFSPYQITVDDLMDQGLADIGNIDNVAEMLDDLPQEPEC